jgi:GntR family transcriptional regulator
MILSGVDRGKPQKLYHQLLEILKENIDKGEWNIGEQIPTEDQLCGRHNVSRATVRLAIAELVSLGYLKKLQGKGTYVRRRRPGHSISMLVNLCEYNNICPDSSYVARSIANKTVEPDEATREALDLSADDHCFFFSRLLIFRGSPYVKQKLYISYSLLHDFSYTEDMKDMSPFSLLENRCGIRIQRVKEMVDLSAVSEEDAGHLEVRPGSYVLRARHTCCAHGDTPVSYSESLYRTDKYPRASEFERLRI